MILQESLKDLHVAIKSGGNIVSHPPQFSSDSKKLFIVSGDALLVYNVETGDCLAQITTPSCHQIANFCLKESKIIILTISGELFEVSLDEHEGEYEMTSVTNFNFSIPKDWNIIKEWLNVFNLSSVNEELLIVARPDSTSNEILLYIAHPTEYVHDLSTVNNSSSQKRNRRYTLEKVCWKILNRKNAVTVGAEGCLVAAVQSDALFVCKLQNGKVQQSKWHKSGTRNFTCVTAHPTEYIVATGDDSGRILLWKNFLEDKSPPKATFHWHTLPVSDITFTVDGSRLLSGGEECCLVRWDIMDCNNRKILPRLGLPIRFVANSPGNRLVAISQADNSIQLVDESNRVVRTIQNITQCYIPLPLGTDEDEEEDPSSDAAFRAGLAHDPNSRSLVMNGRPGHLQCYSLKEDRHLYSLDITQQNYVTGERKKKIPNTEVTHVSFSSAGKWLATVESLQSRSPTKIGNSQTYQDSADEEKIELLESKLKFWKWDSTKQIFTLNTCVNWPHETSVECLRVQPLMVDTSQSLISVTSGGSDGTFKCWGLVYDESSIHGKKDEWWNCENVGTYRGECCGPLAFSQDGSVLGVAFGETLTLWDVATHTLAGTLVHSKLRQTIKILEFSSRPTSNILLSCTKHNLAVWDVLTLSLLWTVPLSIESLAVDRFNSSNIVAVFTTMGHLYFFKPEIPEPLASHKNISRSRIVSSLFVPSNSSTSLKSPLRSTLVFVNASQELCALLPKSSEEDDEPDRKILRIANDASTLTPFAKLIADKVVSAANKKSTENSARAVGLPGARVIRDILETPSYGMPSVSFYCSQLLASISKEIGPPSTVDSPKKEQLLVPEKPILTDEDIDYILGNSSDDSEEELATSGLKEILNSSKTYKTISNTASVEENKETAIKQPHEVQRMDESTLDLVSNEDLSWIKEIVS